MLTLQQRLRPRAEEVAAKVIDGEAIIINLANGMYYSMDRVGGMIWDLLQNGQTLEGIVGAVTDRYDVSRDQATADLEALVNELLRENLVAPLEGGDSAAAPPRLDPRGKLPYQTPTLNVYRDMGDLLALDPPMPDLEDTPWKDPGGTAH